MPNHPNHMNNSTESNGFHTGGVKTYDKLKKSISKTIPKLLLLKENI